MPQGNPKPQTKATDKYQKKVGYMVKGFKLKRELVEQYGVYDLPKSAGRTP